MFRMIWSCSWVSMNRALAIAAERARAERVVSFMVDGRRGEDVMLCCDVLCCWLLSC